MVSKRLRPIVVCLLMAWPVARADTYPRQSSVDVQHYTFRLTLNDETSQILGETTVRFLASGANVGELTLDLASAANGKGMTVAKVESNAKALKYTHENNRLKIELDPPVKAGEAAEVTVTYSGVPVSGFLIGKNRHGDRTFFSENWPDKAHQWLPTIDHPYDKATSEFIVKAPARYQVVSNGLLQEETDQGGDIRLTHWKQSIPISTWLNALAVAPFASHHAGTVNGIPLQTWVFRQDRDKLFPALEVPARRAVELFSEKVGPYPFEKIAGIQAVGFDGGMELASAIFYGQYSLSGRDTPALVAHEMAHQWFGDAVTESDWNEVWLSEGFATFFAHVYAEKYQGRQAYIDGLKRSRPIIFASERRDPKLAIIHQNLSDTRRILNALVYQKGAWFLHMLRNEVGDDAFWKGIKDYYARFRNQNATTDDFRKAIEQASQRDLAAFFDQWLKRPGSPKVEATWSFDPTAKTVTVALAQTQASDPYQLLIEMAATEEGKPSPTVHKVNLKERNQTFTFPAATEPTSLVLDPETKVLMDAKVIKKS